MFKVLHSTLKDMPTAAGAWRREGLVGLLRRPSPSPLPEYRARVRPGRRGFTLVEMLVVISIIVLVVGMAVPLFRVMSTDRSVESGQNIVSAMLQRARSRAIGLQSPRGIFFFEDQATKKTAMVMVRIDDPTGTSAANVLELDEESDEFQF